MDSVKSASGDDATVRKLDEFPELLEALRDGDLLTARSVCAQLFGIDPRRGVLTLEKSQLLVEDSIRRVERSKSDRAGDQ